MERSSIEDHHSEIVRRALYYRYKYNIPSPCYQGDIFIESNCEADSVIVQELQNIIVTNNATLTVDNN